MRDIERERERERERLCLLILIILHTSRYYRDLWKRENQQQTQGSREMHRKCFLERQFLREQAPSSSLTIQCIFSYVHCYRLLCLRTRAKPFDIEADMQACTPFRGDKSQSLRSRLYILHLCS